MTCSPNKGIFPLLIRQRFQQEQLHSSGNFIKHNTYGNYKRNVTNHKIDWDSAKCVTYSTDYYFQRITLESCFPSSEQTPLNPALPTPTCSLQTTYNDDCTSPTYGMTREFKLFSVLRSFGWKIKRVPNDYMSYVNNVRRIRQQLWFNTTY